jgi:hypothetical protein
MNMKFLSIAALLVILSHFAVTAEDAASVALDKTLQETAGQRKPVLLDMTIGWHKIKGAESESEWYILDTRWWVRLHNAHMTPDKTKQYEIHGVALEQNYGVIDVWVYDIKEKKVTTTNVTK